MVRFGAITIDVSHPLAFARELEKGSRGRYTAVYNDGFRENDELLAFAENYGLKICATLDELADSVDVGMVHACNWDKHLSYVEPFMKRGKPIFIDKPIVGNLADCRLLEKLAADGAKIIGTSALRYCDEVQKVRAMLCERGTVVLHMSVTVGCDEFNYAIHAIEEICAVIDSKPISARYIGTAELLGEHCDSYMIYFKNGATACVHNYGKKFSYFNTVVMTADSDPKSDFCFRIDNSALYSPMLEKICDYIESGENSLAAADVMIESVKTALAFKASKENGGAVIALDSELLWDVCYDGYAFEREYAASAKKIYL